MSRDPDQDRLLAEWTARIVEQLGVDQAAADAVDIAAVLRLAAAAAHTVVRPAAPLTTFVVGYAAGLAVGRGLLEPDAAIESATATALQTTKEWADDEAAREADSAPAAPDAAIDADVATDPDATADSDATPTEPEPGRETPRP